MENWRENIQDSGDVGEGEGGWGGGGGGGGAGGGGVTRKLFGSGCATGTLKTPHIHIISRLTKHTYSYNLHIKRDPIHIIEDY